MIIQADDRDDSYVSKPIDLAVQFGIRMHVGSSVREVNENVPVIERINFTLPVDKKNSTLLFENRHFLQ